MQMIPAFFTSLFTGGAAAGATAGGVASLPMGAATFAGAAGGAAGGASSSLFASILQGSASLVSAMSAIGTGQAQSAAYNAEAQDTTFQAAEEGVQGRVRRDSLRKGLVKQLGEQDVANAASGIDLSFGTPAIARDESKRDAANAVATDLSNQDAKQQRLMQRAAALRRMAQDARMAGVLKGVGGLLDTGVDIWNRG